MYIEPSARSQLAVRKFPIMPTLIVDRSGSDPDPSKCKASATSPCAHRKTRNALSLCAGILFCTLVLFMLVALDPTKVSEDPRLLVTFPYRIRHHAHLALLDRDSELATQVQVADSTPILASALEGMGILLRKGTRAMPELVVAHLCERTTPEELRLFLRVLHRSGLPARADVVLLFPTQPLSREFLDVIHDEENSFQRLLASNSDNSPQTSKLSVWNAGAYTRPAAELGKRQESVWGKGASGNDSNVSLDRTHDNYGAVVGFDMLELDPGDSLRGFLDETPANLRRWVCYQILLGMVRQRYRHVLLSEVTGVAILKDALSPLKRKDPTLHLFYTGQQWTDPEKSTQNVSPSGSMNSSVGIMQGVYGSPFWNSLEEDERTQLRVVSAGVIMGGIRPVRSVASAMATEIVRVALLRKSRDVFAPEAVLSFLVHKSSVLGKKVAAHLQVHESGLLGVNLVQSSSNSRDGVAVDEFFRRNGSRFAVVQGLQKWQKLLLALREDICASQRGGEVYRDCFTTKLQAEA